MSSSASRQRPLIIGPDEGPAAPFPIKLSGPVIAGFGRGSKQLGIPTANIPPNDLPDVLSTVGVYIGFAALPLTAAGAPQPAPPCVYPMVMSVGWNPYFKNEKRSIEVHLLERFAQDFYGFPLRVLVLGFVRPEQDYGSMDALVEDIITDIEVTRKSLAREAWAAMGRDPWLLEDTVGPLPAEGT